MRTRFINANLYTERFRFEPGSFVVADGRFVNVETDAGNGRNPGVGDVPGGGYETDADTTIDLHGAYVIPGLVDIHTHGIGGDDVTDGDEEGLHRMALAYAKHGVTTFLGTSTTEREEVLAEAYRASRTLAKRSAGEAHFGGIHMEGPFLSAGNKGAQNGAYLLPPDTAMFHRLMEESGGQIRIADIAPELDGAAEFIKEAGKTCRVSLAHTQADYDTAAQAIANGASHVTHLFNAMPPLHHRMPGVVAAAAEAEHVTAELICDGMHIHPAMIRLVFRLFGTGRVVLISDSVRCCGMPDGDYTLGGLEVHLTGGVVRLDDGTIAGAASDLYANMLNAVRFGIPKEDAVRAATCNPACVAGIADVCGSIAKGKQADFIICAEDLTPKEIYIAGEMIQR